MAERGGLRLRWFGALLAGFLAVSGLGPGAVEARERVVPRLAKAFGMRLDGLTGLDAGFEPGAYRAFEAATKLLAANRGAKPGRFLLTRPVSEQVSGFLKEALDRAPDFAAAHYLAGLLAARAHHYGEALADYRKAAAQGSGYAEGPLKDVFVQTVSACESALRHDGDGGHFLMRGKLGEALDEYRKAVALMPDFAQARANLGLVDMLMGHDSEAVSDLEETIRLDPDLAEAHYNLGNVYMRLGKYGRAIPAYRAAIRLKPDNAPPDSLVSAANAHQGAHTVAVARHQSALRHASLATAYFEAGRSKEAISEYERALKLEPAFADVQYNLGILYEKAGKLDLAIAHLKAYTALAVQDPARAAQVAEAEARLERLERRVQP